MGLLCFGSLSTVGYTRVRSVSESESYFSLSSSFHTPTFLKTFYQGSLGSLASLSDSESLKRWEGASVSDRSVFVSPRGCLRFELMAAAFSAPVCFLTQRLQSLCHQSRKNTSVTYSLFLSKLLDFVIVHRTRGMHCLHVGVFTN